MINSNYLPPVFHVVYAESQQIETMITVIDTLIHSNISCCLVRRDDEEADHLWIDVFGRIPYAEKKEIFEEVVEQYRDDMSINRITVNEI